MVVLVITVVVIVVVVELSGFELPESNSARPDPMQQINYFSLTGIINVALS